MRTTLDQRRSLGVHLCQKDFKSVKKWLSYGYLPTERLCDYIENFTGQLGILGGSFVPKISKICQEMAELWLFSHWEVAWFHWKPHGLKGHPWAFFCAKKIQNQSTNGWVWAFYHLSMRQREILCSFIPKVLKSVKKWLSYCHFLPERSKKIKGNALINISAKSVSRFTFWTLKQLDNII